MDVGLHAPIPILRMFDVEATKRFYLEYLGCQLDWQEGDGDRPVFMQVSRGPLVLNLSSHHGDGTPGTAVLVVVDDVDALQAELRNKGYPFMSPGSNRTALDANWSCSIPPPTRFGSSSES